MPLPAVYALVLLLLVAVVLLRAHRSSSLPLPPGPKSSWFARTNLPKDYPWRTYAQWSHTYGDLVYIRVLGNPILVLNSAQAVSDLLEKRSGNYSSRPIRTMVVDLLGWGWLFSSMRYGNIWKRHRNLFLKYFPMNHSSEYHPTQTLESHTLLRNLLDDPEHFRGHVRRASAATILSITYGIAVNEEIDHQGDNFVTLADRALSSLARAGIFGTYMVDYVPMLRYVPSWFPGASFKRQARTWRKATDEMVQRPFQVVKQRMADGTASSCIVANELERILTGKSGEAEQIIRNVAATCYAAGADTVVSALSSLFLAVCLYPQVQSKAQAQLDKVLEGRLPTFADRSQLPYIDCICYELLRWNPVTPLGLAHYVSEEDHYQGYRIPKGTTVIPNVWAILHDPAQYPNPFLFDPERFSDRDLNARKQINGLPDAAFGFGRRMCPGRYFAFDMLWIATASILSVLSISKATDENGNTIEPEEKYVSGLLSHPNPFPCKIIPRSREAQNLILETIPF